MGIKEDQLKFVGGNRDMNKYCVTVSYTKSHKTELSQQGSQGLQERGPGILQNVVPSFMYVSMFHYIFWTFV